MLSNLISAVSLFLFTAVVHAQTSLYIPGLDPQPISAGVLGVGNDGRTTWEIQQGTLSGTFTDPGNFGFYPVPVTMVEGPNDAVYSVAITDSGDAFAIAVSCTINNGVAVCVDTVSESSTVSTDTDTETVSPFAIQGGGPVSSSGGSAPAPTSAPASGSPTQSSGGSQASAGSSPASSGAQATGTPGGKNGAKRHEIAGSLLLLGVIGNAICYIL